MRLVMLHTISDGSTYSCELVLPIEHDSVELAQHEFYANLEKARKAHADWAAAKTAASLQAVVVDAHPGMTFEFADRTFHTFRFPDSSSYPRFLTLDQWYKRDAVVTS